MRRHKGQSYGGGRMLPRGVVVGARTGAQLMTAAAHRAKGSVQEVLELCQLVINVDVALAAQAVGFGMRRVDKSDGLGRSRLHDLGLRHQPLLLLDAFLYSLLVSQVAVLDQPVSLGLGAPGAGLVLPLGGGGDASRLLAGLDDHAVGVLASL